MNNIEARALLKWYTESGVDEALEDAPRDWRQTAAAPAQPHTDAPTIYNVYSEPSSYDEHSLQKIAASPALAANNRFAPITPSTAIAEARALADGCTSRDELIAAIRGFEGCSLKKTATNTVISDGNPEAKIMLIGEAPGAEEDRQGIPFCGPSGKLLDKMLAAISLTRNEVYISNTVFWRPPGNRQPSSEEIAICEPFVQKHIALINPRLLILSGGTATAAVLKQTSGISRLRGKFHELNNPYLHTSIPVAVLFHPSYLLRSPAQKRLAWQDMLQIQGLLNPLSS